MLRKVLSLCACVALMACLAFPCFATTVGNASSTEDLSQNYNVTTECPWENATTRGVNPPTEGWNVHSQGKYSFSGKGTYSTLYLSKLLYGAQMFKVSVTNRSETYTLVVNPHDSTNLTPFSIAPSTTLDSKVFTLATGKTYFCLSFNAPSDFEGYVQEYIYQ